MLYESLMAEYRMFPDEADERFSLRQMFVLLEARTQRKLDEYTCQARAIWREGFGEGETTGDFKQKESTKDLSFFGIKVEEEGGDSN